jgi:hypothetical protein
MPGDCAFPLVAVSGRRGSGRTTRVAWHPARAHRSCLEDDGARAGVVEEPAGAGPPCGGVVGQAGRGELGVGAHVLGDARRDAGRPASFQGDPSAMRMKASIAVGTPSASTTPPTSSLPVRSVVAESFGGVKPVILRLRRRSSHSDVRGDVFCSAVVSKTKCHRRGRLSRQAADWGPPIGHSGAHDDGDSTPNLLTLALT